MMKPTATTSNTTGKNNTEISTDDTEVCDPDPTREMSRLATNRQETAPLRQADAPAPFSPYRSLSIRHQSSYEGQGSDQESDEESHQHNDDQLQQPEQLEQQPRFWNTVKYTLSTRPVLLVVASALVGFALAHGIQLAKQETPTKTCTTIIQQPQQPSPPVCPSDDPLFSLKPSSCLENLQHAAVAADHPLCSQMGLNTLSEGGNAVDAAVTVALCLGVANPGSSGLGGGAFLLLHMNKQEMHSDAADNSRMPLFDDAREQKGDSSAVLTNDKITEVVDCREVAPKAASTDMFEGKPASASVIGGLAVAVPGELKGLELAHARHGRLPWKQVLQPVIDLADQGVPVNANLAHEIQIEAKKYQLQQLNVEVDFGLRNLLTHNDNWDTPLLEGELLQNKALAQTLKAVRDKGASALYEGDLAEKLAKDIQQVGGIVTIQDLNDFRATLRSPIVAHDIQGFSIVGVPPPSSGGAAIVGAARFLSGYTSPLASFAETLSRHRIVEATKHAFAIRMSLSDPAFNSETVKNATRDLVEGSYMETLRLSSRDDTTLPLSHYGGTRWAQLKDTDGAVDAKDANEGDRRRLNGRRFGHLNDHGTTHFVIVDSEGNAVSMTSSVNTYFGSNVVSKSTGIVLGNTMDDFSNPGRPNYFGLHSSPANYIKPGKKPLSSMAPTMVFHRNEEAQTGALGKLVLVLGASGGPKIISAVISVLTNYLFLGMPIYESVIRPRLHDQLIYHNAAVATVENTLLNQGPTINVPNITRASMLRRGHDLLDVNYQGTVQAVAIDTERHMGELSAVCDVRKGGRPAGY